MCFNNSGVIISMKAGLFILSIAALTVTGYFLITEVQKSFDISQVIYIALLFILFCNSVVGIIMTFPEVFAGRRKLRQGPAN